MVFVDRSAIIGSVFDVEGTSLVVGLTVCEETLRSLGGVGLVEVVRVWLGVAGSLGRRRGHERFS